MSERESKNQPKVEIGHLVEGDVIGGIVGDEGKVRIDHLEVVKGDKVKVIYGDSTVTEIDVEDPFYEIYRQIAAKPKGRIKLTREVEQIRQEVQKGDDARPDFLQERLRNLAKMAPDIFEVTVATLANPALGFAVIAKKIATKAREDYTNSRRSDT